ncbi:MAG: InlB B-repeat-containing protein [Prevotella sp.]|nr:InlB B-repeat-containing protein [Prevotella sp.]MBR2228916.1 InlB B-repeat-containing protein [Prevotella sp.]
MNRKDKNIKDFSRRAALTLLTALMVLVSQTAGALNLNVHFTTTYGSMVSARVTYTNAQNQRTYVDYRGTTFNSSLALGNNQSVTVAIIGNTDGVDVDVRASYKMNSDTYSILVRESNGNYSLTAHNTYDTDLDIDLSDNRYYVSYKSNDDHEYTKFQTFKRDTEQALDANTFTRDGYTFTGWNTMSNGTGTSYADGQKVTNLAEVGATIDLYAQWVDKNITLYASGTEADGNATTISNYDGLTMNATLSGTTLKRDGTVQTICLPFSLDDFTGTPLEGFTVLSPTSGETFSTNAFVIKPTEVSAITAHKPYIIKWKTEAASDIKNPKFDDVVIEAGSPEEVKLGTDDVSLCGIYSVKSITASGSDYYVTTTGAISNAAVTVNALQVFVHNYKPETYTEIRLDPSVSDQPVWSGSGTEADPYIIETNANFEALAYHVNNGETYKGKFFKMTANISTTAMVGDYGTNAFMGTFDGDGHTLTVSYTGITEDRTAPFRRISGATIKNLHTAGTIKTSARYAGGIVGYSRYYSKIENCRSSVTIRSSHEGWASHGGIMALKANVGLSKPTIEGCVFDSKILSTGTSASTNCAAIVGYTNGQTLTISNCLYVPAALESGETSAEFGSTLYNNSIDSQPKTSVTCENCYYTEARGTAQGTHTTTYAEAPTYLGTLVKDYEKDYGFVTAYSNGILFNNSYYVGDAENITFADDADNDVASVVGKYVNVTIDGRTIYKDNNWNTLCLPFDVSDGDDTDDKTFTGTVLEGATVKELDTKGTYDNGKQTGLATDGTLYLYFKDVTEIKAGKPYLIKWTSGDDIVNPTFRDVTISNAATTITASNSGLGTVEFIGTYSPVNLDGGDASNLYLGVSTNDNDTPEDSSDDYQQSALYYPSSNMSIKAFRAYFHVDLSSGSQTSNGVRAFVLNFGDNGETTEIVDIEHGIFLDEPSGRAERNMEHSDNAVYDLQGRRVASSMLNVQSSMLKKGVYIYKGNKIVIK